MGTRALAWLVLGAAALAACRAATEPGGPEPAAAHPEASALPAAHPLQPEPGPPPEPFAHPFEEAAVALILAMGELGDPPPDPTNAVADDPRAARLGQFLFFEQRLSGTGTIACATCHEPGRSWTDGREVAEGLGTLTRHTPSLWNVAYNRWFFWDGRADSLWSQALSPLEHPDEHGGSRLQYAHLVHGDPELRAAYERVFGPLPELEDTERFPPEGRPVPDLSLIHI